MSAAVVHVIGDAWVYECLFKVNLTHQQTCLRVIFNLLFWLSTGGGEHDTNEAETHKGGLRGYAVHMTWHNQICWPILHFKIPCNMRVCVFVCVCVAIHHLRHALTNTNFKTTCAFGWCSTNPNHKEACSTTGIKAARTFVCILTCMCSHIDYKCRPVYAMFLHVSYIIRTYQTLLPLSYDKIK